MFPFLIFVFPLLTNAGFHRFLQNDKMNPPCRCVIERLCEDDDVLVNGHGLLDPRISNIICKTPGEVCCDSVKSQEDVEDAVEDYAEPSAIKPVIVNHCGIASLAPDLHARILSTGPKTTATKFGELPWNLIVQEFVGGKERNLYRCGASLIQPKVAVTAAHCVSAYLEEPEKVVVRAGEWDSNSRSEPMPYQDRFVEEIIMHPNYKQQSLKNDVALIILSEDFVLADNVALICLPSPDTKVLENKCIASGWGKDGYQNGQYSAVLKKVQVPIVQRQKCLQSLRNTRLGRFFNLHRSFICAGGEKDKDACKGDGGSPLICPIVEQSDKYVQMGIVSWGMGCGTEGVPGIYVNVGMYLDWIDNELADRDIDTSLYRL